MNKLTTAQKALVELNEKAAAFAKKEVETTDELNPFMVTIQPNGDNGFADVGLLFTDEMEEMKRIGLQHILYTTKAVAFVLVSEAWTASYTDEQVNDPNRRPAREREDRTEVLIITSEHREGDWTMAVFEILRDKDNKRTVNLSNPFQADTGKGFGKDRIGALVNLFEGI